MISFSQSARSLVLIGLTCTSLTGPVEIASGQEPKARIGILLAAGDFMSCAGPSRLHASENVTEMVRVIKAARDEELPVAVLLLGDLAYEDGGKNAFGCFHEEVTQKLSDVLSDPKTTVMPVPGNHDLQTHSGKWFYTEFKDNQWIGDGKAGDDKGYYAAAFPEGVAGYWRLFAINSQIDTKDGGSQYLWLQEALRDSPERCVLAFWHAPVFSSGRHGHDESVDIEYAKPVRQEGLSPIFDLFYAAHASLVLNGHDHDFEHLAPHNSAGEAVEGGLRAFVVGTGGKKLYKEYAQKLAIKIDFDAKDHGFLKIDMYPDSYDWQFLKAGGTSQKLYNGSGTCNAR